MNTPEPHPFLNNMLPPYQGQDDRAIAARAHAVMSQRNTQLTIPPNHSQTPATAGHPYAPYFHYQNAYGLPLIYGRSVPPRAQLSRHTTFSSSNPEWTRSTYSPIRPPVAYDAPQQFYRYHGVPVTPYMLQRRPEPLAQQITSYPTSLPRPPSNRVHSGDEFNVEDRYHHGNAEVSSLHYSAFAHPEPALAANLVAEKLESPSPPLFQDMVASITDNADDENLEQREEEQDQDEYEDEAMNEAPQTQEAQKLVSMPSSHPSMATATASNPPSPSLGDMHLPQDCLNVLNVESIQADKSTCTPLLGPEILTQSTSTTRITPAPIVYAQDLADPYCPRRMIDVWDAATFITYISSTPTPTHPFHPSSQKSDIRPIDRGHTRKHPIGELMIRATLADPYVAAIGEALLSNQDDKAFCLLNSVAAPQCIGLPEFLGNIEFTLVEAVAYFPTHFRREAFLRRLCRAGMTQGQIKSWINYFRQLDGASMLKGSVVGTTLDKWGKMRAPSNDARTTDFSALNWTSDKEPINYPLLLLDLGVVHRPRGEDAGPLTRMIEWCRENGRYHTLLSDVPELLEELGISKSIERPVSGGCPDRAAFARWKPAIERDRLRRTKPAEKAYEAERRTRRLAGDVHL